MIRPLTSVRIVRRCPRCRVRQYVKFWIAKGTAQCNQPHCGHEWHARLIRDERPDYPGDNQV